MWGIGLEEADFRGAASVEDFSDGSVGVGDGCGFCFDMGGVHVGSAADLVFGVGVEVLVLLLVASGLVRSTVS